MHFAAFVRWLGVTGFLAFLGTFALGQEAERGRPLLRSWGATDYRASPQVARVAVGPDGVLYFASANLVLWYDGHEFGRLETPLSHIRSMVVQPDGSIFLGGADDLGVVRPDAFGRPAFRSLFEGAAGVERKFGVVWEAAAAGEDVWFSAERHVFRSAQGRLQSWAFTNGPGTTGVMVAGTNVFAQTTGVGLREFDGREFVTRSTNALVARGLVTGMAAAADGGWWVLSRSAGLLRWRGESMEAVAFPGSEEIRNGRPAQLDVLPDGRLLIATGRAGLFLVDPAVGVVRHWGTEDGLLADAIRDVWCATDGTWWLATDVGLQALDLPLAVTVFDERRGLPAGLCGGLMRHEGRLVISLLDGIHELWPAEGTNAATWRPHPHSIHYPQEIASDVGGLLVTGEKGLYRLTSASGDVVFPVTGGLMSIARIPGEPARWLCGLRDGAVVLEPAEGKWRELRTFPGLGEVRNIVPAADGSWWLATTARGSHRVVPGAGNGRAAWESATVRSFNRDAGGWKEAQDYVQAWALPDGPRIVGNERVWKTLGGEGKLEEDDSLVGAAGPLRWLASTAPAGSNAFWGNAAYSSVQDSVDYPLSRFERGADGRWKPAMNSAVLADALGFIGSIRTLREDGPSGEIVWAKGMDRLIRLETRQLPAVEPGFGVRLIQFAAMGTNQTRTLAGTVATTATALQHTRRPYVFRFAAGRPDRGAAVQYQYRLVGWDDVWSPYSDRREATWSGLPGGAYRFEVRGRDRSGRDSAVSGWVFEVLQPWYLSLWAWVGYGVAGLILFQGAVRLRVRQAEARARDLEAQVQVRTRELAEARDAAEEANRAKSRFLANMSHELRTPLNGILGFTQILARDDRMDARNRERLRVIRSSGDHLLGLINDVLDLSKVESGRVELRLMPLRPADLLRDVEASFRPRATERSIQLEVQWAGDAGDVRMGDAQRLRQVLENLLGNALKFTQRGSVSVRGVETGEGRVRFEVVDTGPGMTAADVGRLFQPFSQAVTGRPPEPGAGLGLAISQHLVGLMGGRIEVESQPGAGSRFTFEVRLPRLESLGASTPETVLDGRVVGYGGPRRRVLVVDDVEINRRLLRELFEPLGFVVMEAASGEAALESVRGGGVPDLAILDLRMPGMDGLELTRRLRQDGRFAGRILAMSASVLGFGRADALASGADDFVGKPFAEEALLSVVGMLLGLEWQRESGPAARVEPVGVGGPVEPPSEELLEPLRSAASRGDIVEFRKLLAEARERSPSHEVFFRQLEAMAAAYRMAALRETLAQRKEAP